MFGVWEGLSGFSGWSRSKARLDARIAQGCLDGHGALHGRQGQHDAAHGRHDALEHDDLAPYAIPAWGLHDFRRTLSTRLNEAGVDPHVVEALLGHTGAKRGVAGVYNRASYRTQKAQALADLGQRDREDHGGRVMPRRKDPLRAHGEFVFADPIEVGEAKRISGCCDRCQVTSALPRADQRVLLERCNAAVLHARIGLKAWLTGKRAKPEPWTLSHVFTRDLMKGVGRGWPETNRMGGRDRHIGVPSRSLPT